VNTVVGRRALAPGGEWPHPERVLARLIRGRAEDDPWVRPALLGVIALAAVVYFWNLSINGYANSYYSTAAQAASQSWTALFFGSLDAANFITIDKPPLAIWLMGLSVRLFGLSSWSILVPEALLGVATVVVLFVTVRRSFGPVAALIAGVTMALSPAAALMFRFNNPDALLTFLLVASGAALLRAVEHGRRRWLLLAGVLVGLAFNTKFLQAYLVLPGFALTYLVASAGSVRRRIVDLVLFGTATLVASAWWVGIVELLPASSRPYVGGSQSNSALELLFGYDGLARIFGMFGFGGGAGGGPTGGGGGGANFGGEAGLLRLFNDQFVGQIAWLIPLALLALAVGLVIRLRKPRTDAARSALLLWGGWILVHALVFSFMSGTIHPYYVVVMAPAIAALVGSGVVDLWGMRGRGRFGGVPLAGAIVATAVLAALILDRTPTFTPGLDAAVLALGLAAAVVVAAPAALVSRRASLVAATVGLVAMLAAPAAYAVETALTAQSGSTPSTGPAISGSFGSGRAFNGPGGMPGDDGGQALGGTPPGVSVDTLPSDAQAIPAGGGAGNGFGGGDGGNADQAVIDYLVANQGRATWIVAVSGANSAGSIQLTTGQPVMAMGGFTGSDPAPSIEQLQSYVTSGRLRFVLLGGGVGGGRGGPGDSSGSVSEWIASSCTVVKDVSSSLYDCAGAAG
jgi:4-amino-4-deoxy-L-arabinose transferase-like glycosyltransferase